MVKLYIRNEYFGSIIYNSKLAQYFNLNHNQTEQVLGYFKGSLTPEGQLLAKLVLGDNADIPFIQTINNTCYRQGVLSAPLKAFFNITKKCNLFCKHCYNDSGRPDSPELALPMIDKILQELVARGIFKVTIAGGEPLFHPDFEAIMTYWEQTDLAVSLVTNGICVSEKRAKLMGKSPNLGSITVSLDGTSEQTNDAVRGQGAFKKALRGIKLIRKHYDRPISVRITLMRSNIDNIEQLPSLLAAVGVNDIKVNSINSYGRAQSASELLIYPQEYLDARQKLWDSAQALGMSVEVPAHKYQRDANDQVGLCKGGEETFEIDGDGSVHPCSFSFGHLLVGNVHNNSFDEIFRNLQMHTINNPWCQQCKGRGGKAEKVFGLVPRLVVTPATN